MTRKLMVFELLLVAAAMAATAVLYSHLPPRVTTHWDLNGRPNGYSPRRDRVTGLAAGVLC